ncbi:ACP S-malonyltransferase [Nocardia arthritidis]|uniref:[acyl-carrier-protein] S-malonyltransferase n=1 Tax=Nocardia arthritidis TaxID=228602 RepID=A0A6G9YLQ9_9NOCA|nr:ACP S-malonyltransferase [Nocardia arthritidis]QIS14235.1 ACP S-malonyltransferase [Nocardia arthritidis]
MMGKTMTGKSAFIFPGKGIVPYRDIRKFLLLDPMARRRLAIADEVVGYRVLNRYSEDDDHSEAAQVAFMVACVALADWISETSGIDPVTCVGPSFGQRALTAYAEILPFPEAVRLTAELARAEQDYFAKSYTDAVTHCFVRVPEDGWRQALAELTAAGKWSELSAIVDEGFYFISVREPDLPWLVDRVRAAGGYSMGTMRPAVHARSFTELRHRMSAVLADFELSAPRLPVLADQDGATVETTAAAYTMLLDGFDQPINWPKVVGALAEQDVRSLYFLGPDKLFHRVDCVRRAFDVTHIDVTTPLRPQA